MKKHIKQLIVLFMAAAMVFVLAACGEESSSESSSSASESESTASESSSSEKSGDSGTASTDTAYTIGFNIWGSGSATFDYMSNIMNAAMDSLGMKGSESCDDTTADTELHNLQNYISSGVDGIVMMTAAETVLPQVASECEDAGMPFAISTFVGNNDDRADINENNPYYVGSVSSDLYAEAYLIGTKAAEDGRKTACMIGGNVGDVNFEDRIAGFTQAFVTEGGGEIVNETRCLNPSEAQEKANAMLSAHSDVDCVYCMVGDYVPGTAAAMETLGLDIPLYNNNANADTVEYIRDGTVVASTSGNDLVGPVATALLINYLDGHQILDEDGKPPEFTNTGYVITEDNLDTFVELNVDDLPYTDEVLQQLLWRYNSDVDYDYFVDFIENHMDLDALKADRG